MKNDYTARNIKKSSPYGHQVRHSDNMTLRSDQHVLNIEGPIMSSIAAPGATGSSATSGISGPSVSKRASSNLDRDSAVYRVKEDPIWAWKMCSIQTDKNSCFHIWKMKLQTR